MPWPGSGSSSSGSENIPADPALKTGQDDTEEAGRTSPAVVVRRRARSSKFAEIDPFAMAKRKSAETGLLQLYDAFMPAWSSPSAAFLIRPVAFRFGSNQRVAGIRPLRVRDDRQIIRDLRSESPGGPGTSV
jgi:hypothetical protein